MSKIEDYRDIYDKIETITLLIVCMLIMFEIPFVHISVGIILTLMSLEILVGSIIILTSRSYFKRKAINVCIRFIGLSDEIELSNDTKEELSVVYNFIDCLPLSISKKFLSEYKEILLKIIVEQETEYMERILNTDYKIKRKHIMSSLRNSEQN